MRPPQRLPGNPVLRRRIRASQVIAVPEPPERPSIPNVRRHAQLFVAALAAIVLAGTLLLALPWTAADGEATPPPDALFTAVSAAAVTGLVTVDTADHWNGLGQAVILVLIQIGGLGFAVGASLLLLMLRRGANAYSLRDAVLLRDGAPALSLREAVDLGRRIVRFTLLVEGTGALLLALRFWQDMPLPRALWHGLFHAVSAYCNAGFDLQGDFVSLAPYRASPWVNLVIMLLIQAGALSYLALADVAAHRRWAPLPLDTKLVLLVNAILLVGGAGFFLAAEWGAALADVPTAARPLAALFQSVSARSAGYATVSVGAMHDVTLFVWVGLMLVGGASGSTAGGVKLTTVGVVAAAVVATLRGRSEPQLFGRRLATPLVFRAMTVIALFVLAHFAVTALLAVTENLLGGREFSFIALMFEAMSALATVGLSTGITPELTTPGKLLLGLAMFVGRLGPLTVVFALQQRQGPVRYRFPEEAVRIG